MIEHSPAVEQRLHWADEIDGFRDQIERKLSPTIRRSLKRELADVFRRARQRVQRRMVRHGEHAAVASLPENRPYSLEQILGDWEPDASRGPR
jgi:endonuclease YncB( thermonuclease family)